MRQLRVSRGLPWPGRHANPNFRIALGASSSSALVPGRGSRGAGRGSAIGPPGRVFGQLPSQASASCNGHASLRRGRSRCQRAGPPQAS